MTTQKGYVSEDNFRGYAGEHIAIADLMMKFIPSSQPMLPGSPYDLIADVNRIRYTVQIKIAKNKGDKLIVDYRKSHVESRNYTREDFDILAVVDLESRKVAYIPPELWVGKTQITMWKNPPKSLNGFGGNRIPVMFDDYLEFPELSVIGKRSDTEKEVS